MVLMACRLDSLWLRTHRIVAAVIRTPVRVISAGEEPRVTVRTRPYAPGSVPAGARKGAPIRSPFGAPHRGRLGTALCGLIGAGVSVALVLGAAAPAGAVPPPPDNPSDQQIQDSQQQAAAAAAAACC